MNLPQEFLERMNALLGEDFPAFLQSYEKKRCHGLRVNTLKISVEDFRRIAPFHLTPIPWTDNGFYYETEDAPSRHPFYYAGLYYLQEPSAMAPAQILPVSPGDRVLDLCAAPGGKATALAAKLQGRGLLVANDISASRAKALLKNLEIFGTVNSFVTNTTPEKLARQFPEFFDRILVDAPCSGEGMFRKDLANARAWSLEKVKDCAKAQKEIVLQAVSMLRPGGIMLYSTCTFSLEENEQVIEYLLVQCPDMELLSIPMAEGFSHGFSEHRAELSKCVRIFPHRVDGEGHFLALLKKHEASELPENDVLPKNRTKGRTEDETKDEIKDKAKDKTKDVLKCSLYDKLEVSESTQTRNRKKAHRKLAGRPTGRTAGRSDHSAADTASKTDLETVRSFIRGMIREPEEHSNVIITAADCSDMAMPAGNRLNAAMPVGIGSSIERNLELHGSQAYYVPESPNISGGIPFLRNGLYLGEIRKGRFEPSQALAMALRAEDCTSVLNFSCEDDRVRRYLCGETIEAEDLLAESKNPEKAAGKIGKENMNQQNGWRLVCVNGYPLGWGKLVNGTLKNKYHQGWRMQQT